MRRIRLAVLATLAACALITAGCEKKTQPDPGSDAGSGGPTIGNQPGSAPTGAGDEKTILIGEVGSLTGRQATFGESTKNGIAIAIDEANATGGVKGKQLVVHVLDSQSKAEEAGNAALRLITQTNVKLLLGDIASSNSLAMADKAQANQVPMITPSSTNVTVTEKGDFIFRVCFIDPFQGFVMAKFAREHLKLTKVAVLRDNKSAYSMGLIDVFTRKFTEMGGKVVAAEDYSEGDSDFRAQLTAIKKAKPEGIYVPGYYTEVGIIARQARELGINAPLMGGDGWDSEKLFELGGSAVYGNYFSNHYSPEDPSPNVQKFIATYKQRHGEVPDSLAALGYDAAKVAIDGLKRAKSLSGTDLRDAIAQTRDFPGVTGTITLDDKRNAVKPAVVLKVSLSPEGKGRFEYVTTISP